MSESKRNSAASVNPTDEISSNEIRGDQISSEEAASSQLGSEIDLESLVSDVSQPSGRTGDAGDNSDETPNEIGRLREEAQAASDRALRTQAELDNYRKRAQREMNEQRQYAAMPLLRDFLQVVDNIDRAIDAGEKAENAAGLLEGFKMVATQIGEVLSRHHCKTIEADGVTFDPNLHEAICQQPSEEHPPNTVVGVAQAGYLLHDRVIRPAQVIVSSGSAEADSGDKG